MALVNALVLSTPKDLSTPLIDTLATREQVSLGLLLDAVFDELMSGRRGDTAHELPDVGELYTFLLALHSGMNVNPRFASAPGDSSASSNARSTALATPPGRDGVGTFEMTREMQLYGTFSIPLIHGWTAPRDSPAHEVFLRTAPTFEDAQNIQFAESELRDELRKGRLDPREEGLLEDIQIVKSFLSSWPTQLTDHGLEGICGALQPWPDCDFVPK